jgi:hypothetical protein
LTDRDSRKYELHLMILRGVPHDPFIRRLL